MIQFKRHSGIYTLQTEQFLPVSMEKAWDFFSNPKNLASITPPEMGFQITSGETASAYSGQIITYKVGIFSFFKSNWVTEITKVKKNIYFIDEQRFGPYRMWHHEHWFKENGNGILMFDKISYKIPGWIFGRMMHFFLIKKQLTKIFKYRFQVLEEIFG